MGCLSRDLDFRLFRAKRGARKQVGVLFQDIDTEGFWTSGQWNDRDGGFQKNPSGVVEGKP